eukprot:gnl/TRDRNA2_/TRDRNA2_130105_c1_seq1.p1 gnl/TRDRNA2_/TRDRNA2_130105_c1~~gnl/TRDRNA2_/TRDRNA2_130105_c1_seq1.p1  ORF type:complete len:102 (+),score=0.91 gnl/TRDRNA2_/TRDRNA2_130105_c1_seq1:339-644(+)
MFRSSRLLKRSNGLRELGAREHEVSTGLASSPCSSPSQSPCQQHDYVDMTVVRQRGAGGQESWGQESKKSTQGKFTQGSLHARDVIMLQLLSDTNISTQTA